MKCHGIEIVIIHKGEQSSFEEELADEVLEMITVFSARLYNGRQEFHGEGVVPDPARFLNVDLGITEKPDGPGNHASRLVPCPWSATKLLAGPSPASSPWRARVTIPSPAHHIPQPTN